MILGERDTDPLILNCQPVARTPSLIEENESSKAKLSNHSHSSSMIVLNDGERMELEDILLDLTLLDLGLF